MPHGSIIDTHLHLWDPSRIRYPWLDNHPLLNKAYLLEDYRAATGSLAVEAMVFGQCEAERSACEQEVAWVCEQARVEPRIKALVAWASLEKGTSVHADLERLQWYPIVRGVRRIIQSEADPSFCLGKDFMDGIRSRAPLGLSFDICIDYRRMASVIELAQQIPEVNMILDHIGKPAIRAGGMHPWAEQMRVIARCPNVVCKISGVATEADHQRWTPTQLKPYINVAVEAFGFERLLFGGDWPVSTQAIQYEQWTELLDDVFSGVSSTDQQRFWSGNARRVYRLD